MLAPILIAAEDQLTAVLGERLVQKSGRYQIINQIITGGQAKLMKKTAALNKTASSMHVLIITDLDQSLCAPSLVKQWLPNGLSEKMMFRVACREAESWALADKNAIADWLSVPVAKLPDFPDECPDPKQYLINLARKSKRRELREALVPARGSTAKVGPEYNDFICPFIRKLWCPERASKSSDSLNRALHRLCG